MIFSMTSNDPMMVKFEISRVSFGLIIRKSEMIPGERKNLPENEINEIIQISDERGRDPGKMSRPWVKWKTVSSIPRNAES